MTSIRHAHTPHIYVVYWPDEAILKVGISRRGRWQKWRLRGAVEIAALTTCCDSHARRIEAYLLRQLKADVPAAFATKGDAAGLLSDGGLGWSECFQLTPSPRRHSRPESPYDYDAAYGLQMPDRLATALEFYEPIIAWKPVAS